MIDGKYTEIPELGADGKPNGKTTKDYKAISQEMMSQVEGIVKSAIGYDTSRGDVVTVENVPFYTPDEGLAVELEKADQLNMIYRFGAMAVPILALLLFVFVVIRPMVKFLTTSNEPEVNLARLLPSGVQEAESKLRAGIETSGERGASGASRGGGGLYDLDSSIDLEQLGEIMAESSRLVKENPQQAALLIRYWINDGRL